MVKEKNQNENKIPEVNIGVVGHVDHGKTTLTSTLTGKFTDEHSEELKRGITIRLGYADIEIRKCPKCEPHLATTRFKKCFFCGSDTEYIRTVSFVDVPGHETLMATVLTGASLMDGAILVIAANEPCPQPQTEEHLEALNISGIKNIIIIQNKIDLVNEEEAKKNYNEIQKLIKGSVAENAPIIPISAIHGSNISILMDAINDFIKKPERDTNKTPRMLIVRSFDINKPGTKINKLSGGIIGGSILEGVLKKGDEIEILPGVSKDNNRWTPIHTKIKTINQGGINVEEGVPGGLIAIGTDLDSYLTKSDSLAGSIAGYNEQLPEAKDEIKVEVHQMKRIVGTQQDELESKPIKDNDVVLMNVGSQRTVGICKKSGNPSIFKLRRPLCVIKDDKIALSMQINNRWRLIGYGLVKN
ncbi:MAG: translation initiation factor IF-2 subunit gamma [DPANN group archaeon]|nr:translation initiation factor IF-2 subunit gamma [DPANN group archaeon]